MKEKLKTWKNKLKSEKDELTSGLQYKKKWMTQVKKIKKKNQMTHVTKNRTLQILKNKPKEKRKLKKKKKEESIPLHWGWGI